MRKFRNKKLATIFLAFLMVFVVAGGFAAFQRLLHINARVHMYAPQVAIVWHEVTLADNAHPVLWAPGPGTNRGIGVPSAGARFQNRVWPTIPADWIALHTGATALVGGSFIPNPQSYLATRATDPFSAPPTPPTGVVDLEVNQQANAWWRIGAPGPDHVSTQHAPGQFPGIAHITEQTLATPMAYINLELNLVFDNLDQEYHFRVTLGNPGDVPLTTAPVSDFDITEPSATTLPGAAAYHIVEPFWDRLAGVTILPGGTVTRYLSFRAPEAAWMAFFALPGVPVTEPGLGELFLDNNFNVRAEGEWIVQIPARLAATGVAQTDDCTDRPWS